MRRWTAVVVAAAGIGLAAALGGARAAPGDRPAFEAVDRHLDRFLFFATFEGLCEDGLPAEAVEAVLEKDAEGRYRNFVYGCPACTPVLEGFRAFAMRGSIYFERKGDALVTEAAPSPVAGIAARLAGKDRRARGAALHEFVSRCTERRLARLRLDAEDVVSWRRRFEEARKKGMGMLDGSEGFAQESCPSCDGSCGIDDAWK